MTWTELARDSEACLTAFGAGNDLTPQGDWEANNMLTIIWGSNLMYSMHITCGVGVGHVSVCRYWKYIKLFAAKIHSLPLLRLFQLSLHIAKVRLGSNARKYL